MFSGKRYSGGVKENLIVVRKYNQKFVIIYLKYIVIKSGAAI